MPPVLLQEEGRGQEDGRVRIFINAYIIHRTSLPLWVLLSMVCREEPFLGDQVLGLLDPKD
jgi:hypothetical protein